VLGTICQWEDFHRVIEREQARVDRHGGQFSVVVFEPDGVAGGNGQFHALASVIAHRIRLTDEAGWLDERRIGVLLPDTAADGAWYLAGDVCRLSGPKLSRPQCTVYVYPFDWPFDKEGKDDAKHDHLDRRVAPYSGNSAASWCKTFRARDSQRRPVRACKGVDGPRSSWPIDSLHPTKAPLWQRLLDVIGSLAGLVLLSPVFLVVALLIKVTSPGSVFFRQIRIGEGGRPFVIWKFRTMRHNADRDVHRQYVSALIRSARHDCGQVPKPMIKLDDDPQISPVGRVLRKACIDELPQLINVLRGEMSLVGPRPAIPYEVHQYEGWQKERLNAMPGMTGLWQVSGKNRLTFDQMVRLDIRYSREKSLWLNIGILCRTPMAILRQIKDGHNGHKMLMEGLENA
jgi:lipopolysaccharide/colanic/teichoic acid biosynthesis glycosyltransferase